MEVGTLGKRTVAQKHAKALEAAKSGSASDCRFLRESEIRYNQTVQHQDLCTSLINESGDIKNGKYQRTGHST